MKNLIIRADASPEIGNGHFMRTFALAQAWKRHGGNVLYITSCYNRELLKLLKDKDIGIFGIDWAYPYSEDLRATEEVVKSNKPSIVVLDGYNFTGTYQGMVRTFTDKLVVIDDIGKSCFCDYVINQNLDSESKYFNTDNGTKLFCGNKYVLLREEFLNWRKPKQVKVYASNILVTMGGSDPFNYTQKVINEIRNVGGNILVVIGADNRRHDSLLAEEYGNVKLVHNANMPELMDWADLAITAGGSTVWELAFMGVPMVAIATIWNQNDVCEALQRYYIGKQVNTNLESLSRIVVSLLENQAERETMSQNGQGLIDGRGADRIVEVISKE